MFMRFIYIITSYSIFYSITNVLIWYKSLEKIQLLRVDDELQVYISMVLSIVTFAVKIWKARICRFIIDINMNKYWI